MDNLSTRNTHETTEVAISSPPPSKKRMLDTDQSPSNVESMQSIFMHEMENITTTIKISRNPDMLSEMTEAMNDINEIQHTLRHFIRKRKRAIDMSISLPEIPASSSTSAQEQTIKEKMLHTTIRRHETKDQQKQRQHQALAESVLTQGLSSHCNALSGLLDADTAIDEPRFSPLFPQRLSIQEQLKASFKILNQNLPASPQASISGPSTAPISVSQEEDVKSPASPLASPQHSPASISIPQEEDVKNPASPLASPQHSPASISVSQEEDVKRPASPLASPQHSPASISIPQEEDTIPYCHEQEDDSINEPSSNQGNNNDDNNISIENSASSKGPSLTDSLFSSPDIQFIATKIETPISSDISKKAETTREIPISHTIPSIIPSIINDTDEPLLKPQESTSNPGGIKTNTPKQTPIPIRPKASFIPRALLNSIIAHIAPQKQTPPLVTPASNNLPSVLQPTQQAAAATPNSKTGLILQTSQGPMIVISQPRKGDPQPLGTTLHHVVTARPNTGQPTVLQAAMPMIRLIPKTMAMPQSTPKPTTSTIIMPATASTSTSISSGMMKLPLQATSTTSAKASSSIITINTSKTNKPSQVATAAFAANTPKINIPEFISARTKANPSVFHRMEDHITKWITQLSANKGEFLREFHISNDKKVAQQLVCLYKAAQHSDILDVTKMFSPELFAIENPNTTVSSTRDLLLYRVGFAFIHMSIISLSIQLYALSPAKQPITHQSPISLRGSIGIIAFVCIETILQNVLHDRSSIGISLEQLVKDPNIKYLHSTLSGWMSQYKNVGQSLSINHDTLRSLHKLFDKLVGLISYNPLQIFPSCLIRETIYLDSVLSALDQTLTKPETTVPLGILFIHMLESNPVNSNLAAGLFPSHKLYTDIIENGCKQNPTLPLSMIASTQFILLARQMLNKRLSTLKQAICGTICTPRASLM